MANICDLLAHRQHSVSEAEHRRIFRHLHSHGSLVEKLGFSCELQGHKGCVNCLQWNTSGNLLASGSDDTTAILWDPYQRKAVASMQTGHTGNIFSVKFLPFSGDKMLITGSEDGEVRLHDLATFDTTQVWSCSQNRIKRVATSPHSPHVCWSASEDGYVRRLDTREPHVCSSGEGNCRNILIDLKLTSKITLSQPVQCKCIDINPVRTELIAVGALDQYARVYDARLCTLRSSATAPASSSDPSCVGFFAPGHLSNPSCSQSKRSMCSSVAATYIQFSPDGRELLVNLSGEQIYLYDTLSHTQPVTYEFDKSEADAVPVIRKPLVRVSDDGGCSAVGGMGTRPVGGMGMRPMTTAFESHSTMERTVDESEIPGRVIELKNTGKELYKAERLNEALDMLSTAILLCPNWHVLYFLRGTTLYSRKWKGDIYAALRDIETALSLHPSHKLSQQRRIQCLKDLGMTEEASRFLNQYQLDHPSDGKFVSRTGKELGKGKKVSSSNGFHTHNHTSNGRTTRPHPLHQRPISDYQHRYCGHCNTHTDIKEAVFIGDRGNYVAAGSDDGNIFIWEKQSGNLVRVLRGDSSIVNCIQWHPGLTIMATSGIENVVRLWEPLSDSASSHDCKGGGRGSANERNAGANEKTEGTNETSLGANDRGRGVNERGSRRVVSDLVRVSRENQHRMGVDPFEVMLMRMGFRLAGMGEEGAAGAGPARGQWEGPGGEDMRGEDLGPVAGGEGRGTEEQGERMEEGEEESEGGEIRWIESPANCRQS